MKRIAFLLLVSLVRSVEGAEPLTLPLWEGCPPGSNANAGPEKAFNDVTSMNVSVPAMTVYLAPREKATGLAIVYCSGGSYNKVSHVSDAVGNADYFLTQGISLIVVKYRTAPPSSDWDAALNDARRAMRIVKHRTKEWNIDPTRIGMLGGSAGAHLILRLATSEQQGHPASVDLIEREDCRPAFVGLLCPWPGKSKVSDFTITSDTAPMFLCSARDDTVAPTEFAQGIANASAHARLWIIDKGGHTAFRIGTQGEGAQWAERFTDWIKHGAFNPPSLQR
jgi:endo-1,4-beta-xylanase